MQVLLHWQICYPKVTTSLLSFPTACLLQWLKISRIARRTNHTLFKLRTRLSRVLLASLWIFFGQWSFWAQRFPCQICGPWTPLNQDAGICPSRIFGCPTHFFSGNFTYLRGYKLLGLWGVGTYRDRLRQFVHTHSKRQIISDSSAVTAIGIVDILPRCRNIRLFEPCWPFTCSDRIPVLYAGYWRTISTGLTLGASLCPSFSTLFDHTLFPLTLTALLPLWVPGLSARLVPPITLAWCAAEKLNKIWAPLNKANNFTWNNYGCSDGLWFLLGTKIAHSQEARRRNEFL